VATGADLAFCVTETNRYRATLGLGALAQHGPSEEFAAAAASSDHQSGIPHAYFRANASGNTAENQANRWPNAQAGGSAHEFISRALAMMWAEGPGGGHYENMRGRWGFLGCGIASDSSSATFVQEFR
jgi:hypothetical protein